jgi:undecaprenyl-diphosphatase
MTYRQAIGIGLCQTLAMIPGVSRSGATVLGGLALGLSRAAIVQFSFLLAVPTMLAATAYDLYKSAPQFTGQDYGNLAVGFVVAFFVAWLVVKWFLRYVQGNDFRAFGVYRIFAAFAYWLLIK